MPSRALTSRFRTGRWRPSWGPSGSGKTTLLNVLGLLDTPSVGSYKLGGDEVAKLGDRRRSLLRNKRFGFIFQVYNLLPRLTAVENVMVPLVYGGLPRRERTPARRPRWRRWD